MTEEVLCGGESFQGCSQASMDLTAFLKMMNQRRAWDWVFAGLPSLALLDSGSSYDPALSEWWWPVPWSASYQGETWLVGLQHLLGH